MASSETVYEMFKRSCDFFYQKHAVIPIDGNGEQKNGISYTYLMHEIRRLSGILVYHKIQAGDKVCLLLPNDQDFITAYLALSKMGATAVLLNPATPQDRILKALDDSGSKLLITQEQLLEIRRDGLHPGAFLNTAVENFLSPADTAAVLYSSGTTGEQKGVELSVSNLAHNIRYTSALTGMTPEDRVMCFIPLTHCFGLNFIMSACLYTGATLVLHEKFDPGQVLKSLVENKVTMFLAPPAVYKLFLARDIDPFYFSSVRYFFYAADVLPREMILLWEERYGRKIYTGWGLTETSPYATSNHPSIYKLGGNMSGIPSVGKPIPGVKIKIIDEYGEVIHRCPLGKDDNYRNYCGEILVKGPNVMKGYLNLPEETAKAIDKDDWFHTGDIGYKDNEGYLYIVDRLKDMINVGGEKAWPALIEKRILAHPGVADAAVVGAPHDIMGEIPKAFVVRKDPKLTAEKLQKFVKDKLTAYEFPRIIEFTDKLPRNPSGKILRRELRDKPS